MINIECKGNFPVDKCLVDYNEHKEYEKYNLQF